MSDIMTGLPSARGGRIVAQPLEIEIVRPLGAEDLPLLLNPPVVGSKAPAVLELRHSHHNLAKMLAAGKAHTEISLITGYSASRISILQNDPAFAELVAFYAGQRDAIYVDVLEKMKVLGLNSIEELQRRLEDSPDKITNRELMELSELMLMKGRTGVAGPAGGAASGSGGVAPVQVSVNFVSAKRTAEGPAPGPVLDGRAE